MLSVPLGVGSSAGALRSAPVTGLVSPALVAQVPLRPQSVITSALPNSRLTIQQLPCHSPSVRTSWYLAVSSLIMIGDPTRVCSVDRRYTGW